MEDIIVSTRKRNRDEEDRNRQEKERGREKDRERRRPNFISISSPMEYFISNRRSTEADT